MLADIHTDEALGKFYADNDFLPELNDLPDSVYDLLNYAKIGKQMREANRARSRHTATLSERRNCSRCRTMSRSTISIT